MDNVTSIQSPYQDRPLSTINAIRQLSSRLMPPVDDDEMRR